MLRLSESQPGIGYPIINPYHHHLCECVVSVVSFVSPHPQSPAHTVISHVIVSIEVHISPPHHHFHPNIFDQIAPCPNPFSIKLGPSSSHFPSLSTLLLQVFSLPHLSSLISSPSSLLTHLFSLISSFGRSPTSSSSTPPLTRQKCSQ